MGEVWVRDLRAVTSLFDGFHYGSDVFSFSCLPPYVCRSRIKTDTRAANSTHTLNGVGDVSRAIAARHATHEQFSDRTGR
jgi:hypothetical protein